MTGPSFPHAMNLKFDKTLRFSDEKFQEKPNNGIKLEPRSKEKRMDSAIGYPGAGVFARFTIAAYQDQKKDEKRLQLPKGWRLLTTVRGLALMDATYGYFGAAYLQPDRRRIVIDHRGTINSTGLDARRTDIRDIYFHKYFHKSTIANIYFSSFEQPTTMRDMAGPALRPYATNLKFDKTLSLSDKKFQEKLKDGTKLERRSKVKRMDSVIAYPEAGVFAKFANAAYQDRKKDESQLQYEKRLQLPKGWRLLTTARGLAFLDTTYGYFGAAYWQPARRRVVIAHRGTVPTNLDALRADIRGIYFHKYVKQMSAACTFALKIRDAVKTVERERQTSFEIFFTGHSLGAWLAQVTTFSLKYLTVVNGTFVKNILDDGYHARTVVFDSPGCEDTIRKMIKDLDVRYANKSTDLASLDITSYLSSPNLVNCCNTHIGKLFRVYPKIDSEKYGAYTLSSHNMAGILQTFENSLPIKEIVDWPEIEIDLWQWKIWKLSDNLLGGKEYRDFFHFATDLNDYDPSAEKIKIEFNVTATNNENKERFVRIRYQTKPARTNESAWNVFTDSELEFLQRFQRLRIIRNSLFECEKMSEKYRSQIAEKLNNLIINTKEKTISLSEEDKFKIFQIIPYVKTLLRLYPGLKERARQALTDFGIRNQIYANITKEYRHKMEYLTTNLNQSNWPEFDHFIFTESSICHVLAECGTDSAMAKVLKVIETKKKDFTVLAFEFQNLVTTETFFHLTEFLKSKSLRDVLLLIAIECKAGTFKNAENIQLVKKVREEINIRSNFKLVIITDRADEINLDDDWVRVSHGGITWDELTNQAQAEIISKNLITLQGNSEKISLQNWTTNLSDFAEILDPETLTKFLKEEIIFVGPKMPTLPDFYVPRKFKYNPRIKEEIFEKERDNDVVAIWSNSREKFGDYSFSLISGNRRKRQFPIITSDEEFQSISENNSGKNIHSLKLESNFLVWHKTRGSLKLIRKYIRDSGPENVLENIEDAASKTLIISDAPGMGKSTVLAVLAQKMKERNPNHWVIRINLNDCTKVLENATKNNLKLNNQLDAVKFLSGKILRYNENTNLISNFERKLFEKSLIMSGGMVLILDAFDEISPDYEEIVLQLVKLLNESRLEKLVLTTRPHTKEQLEDQLSTLSYTMVPFFRDDQKNFLKQFWKRRLKEEACGQINLDDLTHKSVVQLEESISLEDGDFLGIPLQCELLAEYTLDKIEKGENQPELKKISLMELYESFVRRKMEIYQEEKNSKPDGKIGAKVDKSLAGSVILKAHRQYALRLMLTRDKWDELDYSEEEQEIEEKERIDTAVRKAGLMLKTGDNPQFVHRTFAEFFVFDYILHLTRITTKKASLKLAILSKEVLLQPEFGVARTFLDGLIRNEQNIKETTEFLNHFVQIMAQNRTDYTSLCLSRQGFTVFHQLVFGENFSVLDALLKMLTDKCGPEIVKYVINTPGENSICPLHIAAANGHLEIIRLLLDKGANTNACTNDDATPLFVASLNGHLEIARLLLENGANTNACTNDDATPLLVASLNGHLEIARLLLEKGANINTSRNNNATPLFVASQNGQLETARLLLQNDANSNACMNDDATPLYIASQYGHLEIARLLLEKGANINACRNTGSTPLFVASLNGHLEIARLLLENGANTNACTNDDATPLLFASLNGHLEIARLLLEKGANINTSRNTGSNPLGAASQNDHLEIARLLLDKGANVNACMNNNETPLFVASLNGHMEIARLLLDMGANINACTNDDATPLYITSQNGHLEIARLLLEKGANINACTNDDATPLYITSQNGHLEIARLLLEKGANINACTNDDATPLYITSQNGHLEIARLLLEKGANTNACRNTGSTPLHIASQNGNLEIARLLLEKGANINACTNNDATPLFVASQNGHLETARLLLENDANSNACMNDDATPLYIASQNGHLEIARLLLEKGANTNACRNTGSTPLYIASQNGHLEIARLLLEKGANINACTNDDATPLYITSQNGNLEIARLLLEKGANINACTNNDATPLFVASQNGHLETARLLLENDANSNACMNDDATPLYIASQNGHLEIARLLLEKGANINACTNDDATPLYITSQNGHLEIARLLLEKGANINACTNDDATPLFVASQNGHLETARLLLENDANSNACMNDDATPLYIASQNGHLEIARLLLDKDANINACRNTGSTPLLVASLNGHLEIARLLLEKGANINACMNDDATPLYIAPQNGHLKIARLLLEKGANINAQNHIGWSSLHVASSEDNLKIVKLLIDGGAKVDLQDYDGTTPLHVASYQGQLGVAKLLVQYGHNVNDADFFGRTPLHSASGQGQSDLAIFLLENGANIDAVTVNDPPVGHEETPLHHAAIKGRTDTVRLLVQRGAYVLARNSHDQTPLDLATIHNHTEIIHILS